MRLIRYEITLKRRGIRRKGVGVAVDSEEFLGWLEAPTVPNSGRLQFWFTELGERRFLDHLEKVMGHMEIGNELTRIEMSLTRNDVVVYQDHYQVALERT